MAAAVEFPVPAPHTGSFVNGEKAIAISSSPITGYTPTYLGRWMRLLSGVYTLKSVAVNAALWQINRGATILNVSNTDEGVTNRVIFVPEDMERFDITLQHLGVGSSQSYVAFSLWRDGSLVYASSADGWVASTTPLSDADLGPVPDIRLSLPVWSILPNWQNGITERLEWLTDVITSETNVEQRRSLRLEPRRSIEAGFLRAGADRQRMDAFFTSIGQDRFTVPVFFEQARISQGISFGATGVDFEPNTLQDMDFAAGDVCMLTTGTPGVYELVQIDTLNAVSGEVTFTGPTARAWPRGVRMIPCRVARLIDPPQFSNRSEATATATVRFTIDVPDQTIAPAPAEDVTHFPFRIDYAQNVDLTYSRMTVMLDNQIAPPMVFDYGRRARVGLKVGVRFNGREAMAALRAFLGAVRGRSQRFWMPSYTRDIEPVLPLTGTTITAKPNGFAESFVSPQEARMWIVVEFFDDTPPIYRRLTGAAVGAGVEVYGIDEAWPTINMAKVRRIMFMVPSRFDQDGFELLHHSDEAKAVSVSFVTMSVDTDEMAPIEE